MSRLGDLESAIVTRLAGATISGSPAFAIVKGVSGDYRAALRDAMLRERTPSAFVAFVKEPTAPETWPDQLGARFTILVVARALRQTSNPRLGDSSAHGAFTLIDTVKTRLDHYAIVTGIQLINLDITFRDADDRAAIYELHYRAWPIFALAAPAAPTNLAEAASGQQNMMKLVWTAPTPSATDGVPDFYRIYRKASGDASFKLFETGVKTPTSKLFTSQAFGTTVQYYVTAVNVAGESTASNTLTVEA